MDDGLYLHRAIELSNIAQGGKNYRVGAVILDKTQHIIGQGYSWEKGVGTHAEENAFLEIPKGMANGGTIYCSMAPCTFRSSGKETCIQRIQREGIVRVVFATFAPDEPQEMPTVEGIEFVHLKDFQLFARLANPHLFQV